MAYIPEAQQVISNEPLNRLIPLFVVIENIVLPILWRMTSAMRLWSNKLFIREQCLFQRERSNTPSRSLRFGKGLDALPGEFIKVIYCFIETLSFFSKLVYFSVDLLGPLADNRASFCRDGNLLLLLLQGLVFRGQVLPALFKPFFYLIQICFGLFKLLVGCRRQDQHRNTRHKNEKYTEASFDWHNSCPLVETWLFCESCL